MTRLHEAEIRLRSCRQVGHNRDSVEGLPSLRLVLPYAQGPVADDKGHFPAPQADSRCQWGLSIRQCLISLAPKVS